MNFKSRESRVHEDFYGLLDPLIILHNKSSERFTYIKLLYLHRLFKVRRQKLMAKKVTKGKPKPKK